MSEEEKTSDAAATGTADSTEKDAPEATEEKAVEVEEESAPSASSENNEISAEPVEAAEPKTTPETPAYKTKLANLDEIKSGMTVRVHEKIKDVSPKGEERERIQVFEGMVIGLRGSGTSRTMTVRKVSKGFGVEKIYPINSPAIDKVELVKTARVRKAKLGYLKNLKRRFKRKLKETHAE